LRQSKGQFSSKECEQISKEIINKNLREIGSDLERWKRQDKEKPLHLRIKTNKSYTLRRMSNEIQKRLGTVEQQRLSDIYSKREELKAKSLEKQTLEGNKARLYTLNKEGREKVKDSAYAIVRSNFAPWLQKLLPEGQALSYEYRQKQFEKSKQKFAKKQKRFEKRQKQFKRKMFFAYMKGHISRSKYIQIRDGKKQEKSKILIQVKYATHNMNKKQRDYLLRKLDKAQTKVEEKKLSSRFSTTPQKEPVKEREKEKPKEQPKEKQKEKSKERDR
jgi:hypothetical protein